MSEEHVVPLVPVATVLAEEAVTVRITSCLMCSDNHRCTGSLCRICSNRGTIDQYREGVDMYNTYYKICPAHMLEWSETYDIEG